MAMFRTGAPAPQYPTVPSSNAPLPAQQPQFDRKRAVRDLSDERRTLMRNRIAAAQRGDSALADEYNRRLRQIDAEGNALVRSDESRYIRDPGEVAASRERLQFAARQAFARSAEGLNDRAAGYVDELREGQRADPGRPFTMREQQMFGAIDKFAGESRRMSGLAESGIEFAPYTGGDARPEDADRVGDVRRRIAFNQRAGELAEQGASANLEQAARDDEMRRRIQTAMLNGTLTRQEAAQATAALERDTANVGARLVNETADSKVAEAEANAKFNSMQAEAATDELGKELGQSQSADPNNPYSYARVEERAAVVQGADEIVTKIASTINRGNFGRATPADIEEISGDIAALDHRVMPALRAMVQSRDPAEAAAGRAKARFLLDMMPKPGSNGSFDVQFSFENRLANFPLEQTPGGVEKLKTRRAMASRTATRLTQIVADLQTLAGS